MPMTETNGQRSEQPDDAAAVVKRVQEVKQREFAANQAAQTARNAIREREQFLPKTITPARAIEFRF
jgi:hypothetical protein